MTLVALLLTYQAGLTGEVAYLPGQLEVVCGIRPSPDTVMALAYGHEFQADFSGTGNSAGQAYTAYNFGYVRFLTEETTLESKPCWHLHWKGRTISHHGANEFMLDATTDYWVGKDGKIIKQEASKASAFGASEAVCDYFPDHIDIDRSVDGKESKMSLFPVHDEIAQLNAQFTPMVVDGKILNRDKSFMILDPYRGTFEKRTARVGGIFDGVECDGHFHGYEVDVEWPGAKQGICVSDDNLLVKVDLQNGRSIELMALPPGHPKAPAGTPGHG